MMESESNEESFSNSSDYQSEHEPAPRPQQIDIDSILSQMPKIVTSEEIDERIENKLKERLKITITDISNRFDDRISKLNNRMTAEINKLEGNLSGITSEIQLNRQEAKDLIARTKQGLVEQINEDRKLFQRDIHDLISKNNLTKQNIDKYVNIL